MAFRGINYRADIWINGKKIAGSDQVVGAFRRYEFDVTKYVKPGAKNVVAVEVSAPHANELGITWVDWNPTPPDKDMGLWQEVVLSASGPVAVRHLAVESRLELLSTDKAHLTVRAELQNASDTPIKGILHGQILGAASPIEFSQSVELKPGEHRPIAITPESVAFSLNISESAPLRWPYQNGRALSSQAHSRICSRERLPHPKQSQTIAFGIVPKTRFRTDCRRRLSPLQSERQACTRARRRLGAGHDAAHQPIAPRSRVPLRKRNGPQHYPPRRQARRRIIYAACRPRRHPRHGWMVLLRCLGKMGQVGRRKSPRLRRFPPAIKSSGSARIPASSFG